MATSGTSTEDGHSPPFGFLATIERLVTDNLGKVAPHARGLILVAAIIAILTGAAAVTLSDNATGTVFAVGGLTVLLLLSWLLYLVSRESTRGEDHAALARALDAVNGLWWQLVVHDTTPGITKMTVELSQFPDRHRLHGEKRNPTGTPMADFRATAIGIVDLNPVEVFYYWEGSYVDGADAVSGVGLLAFPDADDHSSRRGTGWFTTGDVQHRDFSRWSKVHIRKMIDEEGAVMRSDDSARQAALAKRVFEEWTAELDLPPLAPGVPARTQPRGIAEPTGASQP
jgi:hypothetical protein